jgi:hypothetical protein
LTRENDEVRAVVIDHPKSGATCRLADSDFSTLLAGICQKKNCFGNAVGEASDRRYRSSK